MRLFIFIAICCVTYCSCETYSVDPMQEVTQAGEYMYALDRAADSAKSFLPAFQETVATVRSYPPLKILTYFKKDFVHFSFYNTVGMVVIVGVFDPKSAEMFGWQPVFRALTGKEDTLRRISIMADSLCKLVPHTKGTGYRTLAYLDESQAMKAYVYPENIQDLLVWGNDYMISFNNLAGEHKAIPLHGLIINDLAADSTNRHQHIDNQLFTAADYFRLRKVRDSVKWKEYTVETGNHIFVWEVNMKDMHIKTNYNPYNHGK